MADPDENRFFVYFRKGGIGLQDAFNALEMHGLNADGAVVQESAESFLLRAEGLDFQVSLDGSEPVVAAAKAAAAIAELPRLAQCDARFTVEVMDLPAALDEINTMMELQGALQDCSEGYLVLGWNGGVVGPWGTDG